MNRIVVVLASLALAVPVTLFTASLAVVDRSPTWAADFWPWNSLALGRVAGDTLLSGSSPAALLTVQRAARRALMIEPGDVRAVRGLALAAALKGDNRAALVALRYSEVLSRRDLPTQLALIEWHVQRGDIGGALRHYDRALRVAESLPVLLSTMIAASANPAVRHPVIDLLKQRPAWRSAFLVQLIDEHTTADTVYGIISALRLDPSRSEERQVLAAAVGKLAGLGHVIDARRLMPFPTVPIRNSDFEGENVYLPFDWTLATNANLSAIAETGPVGRGRVLYLDARNGLGGEVASEWLSLKPGNYQLALYVGNTGDAASMKPQLAVTCQNESGKTLVSFSLPPASSNGVLVRTPAFIVDQLCTVQRLAFIMPGSLDDGSPRPWVDGLEVLAAR